MIHWGQGRHCSRCHLVVWLRDPRRAALPCTPAPLRPPPCTASLCDPSSLSLCWARPGGGDRLGATEDKRLPEFVYGERPGPACQQPFPTTGPIPEQGSPGAEENLPLASLGLSVFSWEGWGPAFWLLRTKARTLQGKGRAGMASDLGGGDTDRRRPAWKGLPLLLVRRKAWQPQLP